MNPIEPITGAARNPFSRSGSYQPPPGVGENVASGSETLRTMVNSLLAISLLSSLLAPSGSPGPGGGGPFSGPGQQPGDPMQQFLQILRACMGGDGDPSADGGSTLSGHPEAQSFDQTDNGRPGTLRSSGAGSKKSDGSSRDTSEQKRHTSSTAHRSEGQHPDPSPRGKPDPSCSASHSTPGKTDAPAQITPSSRIPQPNGMVLVHEPIVVKAGQTFDGGGKLYKAGPELGDGGQSETQKPVFVLEPGAKLENLQVQGADGVHANGNASLKNVWWRDVGEDAFTLKKPGNVTVEGGGAFNASDKVFQINAPGSISINGFYAENFGKLVRQNGNHDFPLTVRLSNVTTKGADEALVRTDSPQARIYLSNVDPSTAKYDVIAPHASQAEGAVRYGYKPYSG